MLQHAAGNDPIYQKLIQAIKLGKKPTDPDLVPFTSVWEEMSVIRDLVCRGERIVIPNGTLPGTDDNVREWVVELGHSGHQGTNATKRLLRLRLWFPGLDKMVEDKVSSCLPCQATVDTKHRDPLKPNTAPTEPWSRLVCDHWGPNPLDGKHILVVIDALTRYPEVVVVRGTSAEDNIHAFSDIFTRHGYPEHLHSDNGPPFNGNDSHLLQQYFKSVDVKHVTNRSALDPEATGLAESFMKHIKKVFHTARIEDSDPYQVINEHLMQFRATPHPTTGKSPAELLFGRKYRTKLPDMRQNPAETRTDIIEARAQDQHAKGIMKHYKDRHLYVKDHDIQPGDKVLLKRKSSKLTSIYDPEPYTATNIWGTQIEAERNGIIKTRDAQRWKIINHKPRKSFQEPIYEQSTYLEDPDIGVSTTDGHTESLRRRPEIPAPTVAPQSLLNTLRDMPDVILADTAANRPTRQRRPPRDLYIPTSWRKSSRMKRL